MFLKNILPETVKSVPAKLCAVFLCTLLKRLQFSPKNVEFWTKKREIRPLKRGTPSVCSRWSQPPSPRGRLNPLRRSRARFPFLSPAVTSSPGAGEVFPLRGSFWRCRKLSLCSRYFKYQGQRRAPSQSPSVTALPKGEPSRRARC